MDITDLILLTLLASTVVLSYGIYLIRKDIEELKELTERMILTAINNN